MDCLVGMGFPFGPERVAKPFLYFLFFFFWSGIFWSGPLWGIYVSVASIYQFAVDVGVFVYGCMYVCKWVQVEGMQISGQPSLYGKQIIEQKARQRNGQRHWLQNQNAWVGCLSSVTWIIKPLGASVFLFCKEEIVILTFFECCQEFKVLRKSVCHLERTLNS